MGKTAGEIWADSRRSHSAAADRVDISDRGAALIETAIILPIFFLVVFAIIEFGLLFGVKLDVSQGAREGSRLAAVNYQDTGGSSGATQTSQIVAETCTRMELAESSEISISLPGGSAIGDIVEIAVTAQTEPITGVFDMWLTGMKITSTLQSRLEQIATYAETSAEACP